MTSTPPEPLAGRALAEVRELHRFLAAWLGAGAAGEIGRLEAALAPGFRMVSPQGALLGRDQVVAAVTAGRGSRGATFAIAIEEAEARGLGPGLCLVTYVERQEGPDGVTARRSSALLADTPGAPNGVRWLHLHETWIAAPGRDAA